MQFPAWILGRGGICKRAPTPFPGAYSGTLAGACGTSSLDASGWLRRTTAGALRRGAGAGAEGKVAGYRVPGQNWFIFVK